MKLSEHDWEKVPVKTGATANPAAGSNPVAVTVAAGNRMLLLYLGNTIVCAAQEANRYVTLTITPDGTNDIIVKRGTAATISMTRVSSFVKGTLNSGVINSAEVIGAGMPIELPTGGKFQITYQGIDAGDDPGPMYYVYKEDPA